MAGPSRLPSRSANRPEAFKAPRTNGHAEWSQIPVLEALKSAIILTDSTGRITFWNSSAHEFYGWRSKEVLGRNILEIIGTPETIQEARVHLATLKSGTSWAGEFDVRCKDGSRLPVLMSLSPIFDATGTVTGIVAVSEDFSCKHADEILLQGENQFYTLANFLPELCWMATGDGSIFWYNEKWYEFTGTSPEEMKGWGWQSVHDPQLLPSVLEKWNVCLRTGASFQMEFPLRGADGNYRWFLTRVRPIRDHEGRITRWFGANTDIHDQRQLIETLGQTRDNLENRAQERTRELKKANEDLRELSAQLLNLRDEEARRLARELHDSVGQLIAAIGMNTATVKAQAHKLDEAGIRAVTENAAMVEQINTEIRTISHLLHPPLLDEVGLASALRWYVDGFCERSKIKTVLDVPPDLIRLSTDLETAIFRIVQECLTNIHRHSGSKTAAVRIFQEDHRILVVAQDSGSGIPAERLNLQSEGRSGVGFRGMAERIRYLDGKLEITSDSSGTIVTAMLPIRSEIEIAAACGPKTDGIGDYEHVRSTQESSGKRSD